MEYVMDTIPNLVDLKEVSAVENGGKILFATDDFFAVAENLLKSDEPIWTDDYTDFGKWMDGWETRRKRIAGHDWTILQLSEPSVLHAVCLDTAFFTGNYAPRFSLKGACLCTGTKEIQNRKNKLGTAANNEELEKAEELHSESWETLLPMMSLNSGKPESRKHYFKLNLGERCFTHLRLNIFPDGGVARLRVYGEPAQPHGLTNGLSSLKPLRGKCVSFSNAHYGHPDHLLEPGPCEGMYNGWETARRLDRPPKIDVDNTGFMQTKGEEWAILMLEKAVMVHHVEVDTSYFKGNCPDNVKILGAFVEPNQDLKSVEWVTILNQTKLMANQKNGLKHPFIEVVRKPINHVKVIIAPDGGLARVRLYSLNYFY